jgi:hypothetical protein
MGKKKPTAGRSGASSRSLNENSLLHCHDMTRLVFREKGHQYVSMLQKEGSGYTALTGNQIQP